MIKPVLSQITTSQTSEVSGRSTRSNQEVVASKVGKFSLGQLSGSQTNVKTPMTKRSVLPTSNNSVNAHAGKISSRTHALPIRVN